MYTYVDHTTYNVYFNVYNLTLINNHSVVKVKNLKT